VLIPLRHPELDSGSIHRGSSPKCHCEERSDEAIQETKISIDKMNTKTELLTFRLPRFARNDKGEKRAAFTLAEVLITLAIIGVVAAMTIPTLISNYQEKANVTKLKVTYSMLANAWQLAYANKGEFKDGDPDDLYNYISPYIKFSKYCGRETGCWPDLMVKFLHGTDWVNIDSYTNYRKAIISNGSLIQFYARSYDNKAPEFRVDINGFAGPNSLGKDIFYFKVENNRVLPRGQKGTDFRPFETHCNMASAVDYNGDSCSAWVIQNNNMDYLHCDDLSWDGKRKCSD